MEIEQSVSLGIHQRQMEQLNMTAISHRYACAYEYRT